MTDPKKCNACEAPEPYDRDGWMEAPSGNIYCPACYDLLFRKGHAPTVAIQAALSETDDDQAN